MQAFRNRDLIRCLVLPLAAAGLITSPALDSPAHAQAVGIPAFLPDQGAVPATRPMPLDGIWQVSTNGKRIRIEGGRAYALDGWNHMLVLQIRPGMVVIRNITPTAPGRYSGDDLPLMGRWNAQVESSRSLLVSVQGQMMPASYRLTPLRLDNPAWFDQEMVVAGLPVAQPAPPPGYTPSPPPGYTPAPPPGTFPGPAPSPDPVPPVLPAPMPDPGDQAGPPPEPPEQVSSPHCNATVRVVNGTSGSINVVDLDYLDTNIGNWRSNALPNTKIARGGTWQKTHRLRNVAGEPTRVRVEYRKEGKLGGWSFKKYTAQGNRQTCSDGTVFAVYIQ